MKTTGHLLGAVALMMTSFSASAAVPPTVRVNQVGYLPDDIKVAVYLGDKDPAQLRFTLTDSHGHDMPIDSVVPVRPWEPARHSARIYFSSVTTPDTYRLTLTDGTQTLDTQRVNVASGLYAPLAELTQNYIRQQRCGYNPAHRATCHHDDGYVVMGDSLDGRHFDVTGGWHDASDYLQYLTTSANTVYLLLEAYRANPRIWGDSHDARGLPGANGVPDILDEARWGLEWMMKMNPNDSLFFNQIADDRDHRYVGAPQSDTTDYGYGPGHGRPVYVCQGYPYGLKNNNNRSRGQASSVAKFASSFAAGADLFADSDPTLAAELTRRAKAAYNHAMKHPGACQTAPCVSPYFYEEDNWVDDMELAAASLARLEDNKVARRRLLTDAVNYQRREPVTPWMGADSARHYQWYPFINLGHVLLARDSSLTARERAESIRNLRAGVARVAERGEGDAFAYGVPFIWCSNNLTASYATQALLYRLITGDDSFRQAETAARDWLFGLNPWGQVMMIMPDGYDVSSPRDPHSAMTDMSLDGRPGSDWLVGGLVDGPVSTAIFNSLWGVHLRHDDRFAPYQGPRAVYHDDYSDYSTNEPTLDGTASLALLLSLLAR